MDNQNVFVPYVNKTMKYLELIEKGYTIKQIAEAEHVPHDEIIKSATVVRNLSQIENAFNEYYDQYLINDDKVMLISDTHIAGSLENANMIKKAYAYAVNNNIKNVIHAGDIIEGQANPHEIAPIYQVQLERLLKVYPDYEEIRTMYLLGNHDVIKLPEYAVKETMDTLKNTTYLGTGVSFINLNNKHRLKLYHQISTYILGNPNLEYDIYAQGHSHYYSIIDKDHIRLPALRNSDLRNPTSGFVILLFTDQEYIVQYYRYTDLHFTQVAEDVFEFPKTRIYK